MDLSRASLGQAVDRARSRGFAVSSVLADAVALPLADDSVDLAVYVATMHHLPSRSLRIGSLNELARVLAASGAGIVSVWSVSHERFDATAGFDTTVDWTLPDGAVVERFYHIYDGDEFGTDLDSSDLAVESTFESRGNWYAVVGAEQ